MRSQGRRTVFTLENKGVEFGELLAAENMEREMAIVGVRVPSDATAI